MSFKAFMVPALILSICADAHAQSDCDHLLGKYSSCSVTSNSGGWKVDSVEIMKDVKGLEYKEFFYGTSVSKNSTEVISSNSEYLGEVYQITKVECKAGSLTIKEKIWIRSWGPKEPTDQEVVTEGMGELNILKASRLRSGDIKIINTPAQKEMTLQQIFQCQSFNK